MDWLDQQGIIYEEKNYADPAIAADLEKQLGHELDVVPTTIIGNTVISGFKRPAIKRALAKHAKNP